jgi:hypothetical protein
LNAWVVFFVLSLTVVSALAFGIVAAYGAVNGILHLFASVRPQLEPKPVLLARRASAGAD